MDHGIEAKGGNQRDLLTRTVQSELQDALCPVS
jgi:hypothetical protein